MVGLLLPLRIIQAVLGLAVLALSSYGMHSRALTIKAHSRRPPRFCCLPCFDAAAVCGSMLTELYSCPMVRPRNPHALSRSIQLPPLRRPPLRSLHRIPPFRPNTMAFMYDILSDGREHRSLSRFFNRTAPPGLSGADNTGHYS